MPDYRKIETKFGQEIQNLARNAITEQEMKLYDHLFVYMKDKHKLHDPADIMLLDFIIFDFIRVKRVQEHIKMHGDFVDHELPSGRIKKRVNESGYYLNALQVQVRANMRELLLTKKERTKANLNKLGTKSDFTTFLAEPVDAVVVEEKKDDKK